MPENLQEMDFDADVAGGSVQPVKPEASDEVGEMLLWTNFYAEQLACTGWSFDEKQAFLEKEENRRFLDEWSDATLARTHRKLAELSFD